MMTTLEICRYKDISKCVCFGSIRSIFSRERLDGFIDPFNGASSLQPHSVLEIVRSAKKITMYSKIIKKHLILVGNDSQVLKKIQMLVQPLFVKSKGGNGVLSK